MNTKVILLRTIPHTGTYFSAHLLLSHPAMNGIYLAGNSNMIALNGLIALVKNLEITFEEFENLIICAITDRNSVFDLINNKEEIDQRISGFEGKRALLIEHIVPRFYDGKFWAIDLFEAGYKTKAVTPIRDPILVVLSILIQSGDSVPPAGIEALEITFNEYQYLATSKESWIDNTYFLPVDLWGNIDLESRTEKIKDLFTNYLGLNFHSSIMEIIKDWMPLHPTTTYEHGDFLETTNILQNLLAARDRTKKGENPFGLSIELDEQIERYRNSPEIKEFFQKHGYKNLCWF